MIPSVEIEKYKDEKKEKMTKDKKKFIQKAIKKPGSLRKSRWNQKGQDNSSVKIKSGS